MLDYGLSRMSVDRRQLLLAIGDVSGHGIGPALLMASARGALRAMSLGRPALAERAARLNRLVAEDAADSGHFMTLFMAEVNTADDTMQWVRAGHDPADIFDPQTQQFLERDGPGAALGIIDQADFETRSMPFLPGQILVMATDGIWVAISERIYLRANRARVPTPIPIPPPGG
jgi:sigma-B regulation protein RsbU (phosphoserine phosphatase)